MSERYHDGSEHILDFMRATAPAPIVYSSELAGWAGLTAHFYTVCNYPLVQLQVPALFEDVVSLHITGVTDLQGKVIRPFPRCRSGPGNICIIPKGEPTEWEWTETYQVLNLYLSPMLLATVAIEEASSNPAYVELIGGFSANDSFIYRIGLELLKELQLGRDFGRLYVDLLTRVLVVHLLRNNVAFPQRIKEYQRGLALPALRRVLDYIHDHLNQDLTLDELAGFADLGIYRFARLFKKSVGQSVHQYVIAKRVEAGKQLLLNGGLTIADIAVEVGFYDQSHFSRHFKRIVGVPPSTFLGQCKNVHKDRRNIQD